MPITLEGYSEEQLLQTAKSLVNRKTAKSELLDEQAEERFPKFVSKELTIGRVLGRGGFCVVSEIVDIHLIEDNKSTEPEGPNGSNGTKTNNNSSTKKSAIDADDEHRIHNVVQDRTFMQQHCIRQGKDYRYAIKRLHDNSKKDLDTFINGVVDLAIETRFLSVVRHPNIIKMRAMCLGTPYTPNYFVILDRLYDILSKTLEQNWKKRQVKGVRKVLDRKGKKEMAFWLERLTVAFDLACALEYLHESGIVYRDLKPDNIGFDVRGDVKIFDFGLAKEFRRLDKDDNGLYKLTGDTGSPRYMAPEVALEQPYNELVDVYSFCILLWYMLKLEQPFEGYTMNMFRRQVVEKGARPACDTNKWSNEICVLLRTGWGPISSRPTMADVTHCLRDEINKHSDEQVDSERLTDLSRKSDLSSRGYKQSNNTNETTNNNK